MHIVRWQSDAVFTSAAGTFVGIGFLEFRNLSDLMSSYSSLPLCLSNFNPASSASRRRITDTAVWHCSVGIFRAFILLLKPLPSLILMNERNIILILLLVILLKRLLLLLRAFFVLLTHCVLVFRYINEGCQCNREVFQILLIK